MRRSVSIVAVLLLATAGFLYQTRLSGELPGVRDMFPLLCGLSLFAVVGLAFANGRIRVLLACPWVYYALSVVLLAALIVFGHRYRGGVYLPGRINPSEFVKLLFVIFAAGYMHKVHYKFGMLTLRSIAALGIAFCVLAAEIAVLHDFGLLAQLGLTLTVMVFAASWLWGIMAVAGVSATVLIVAAKPMGHLAKRFAVWRDPFADMTGAGWQTLQGLAALVSGGWWGKGIGMGEVHAVPIVSSDFVYVALAEEVGFAGCVFLLVLWLLFLSMSLLPHIRELSTRELSLQGQGVALLTVGLVASLGIQLTLNVAGVLNALPMTGITLPLLSHGGSSLVAVLAMCGLLCTE